MKTKAEKSAKKKPLKSKIDLRIQHRWTIFVIVMIAIILMVILQEFSSDSTPRDIESARYILSAISQGLAALFALIFTISLIVMQISYRDSNLINEFFSYKFNLIYALLNGIGIVFPLIVLKMHWYTTFTNISITIAFICVFFVIPFFLKMKDFLRFNVGIRETVKIARSAIDRTDVLGYTNILREILGLSQSAINQKNYIVVPIALRELLLLSKYAYSKGVKVFEIVGETVKQFCIHLRMADREGILKNIWFIVVETSEIPNHIQKLDKYTYFAVSESLIDITKSATSGEFKRMACCAVWIFSATWLARNRSEEKHVREQMLGFAGLVGQKLVLECNDPQGPHDYYENAAWKLMVDTHQDSVDSQMLDKLRSWIK